MPFSFTSLSYFLLLLFLLSSAFPLFNWLYQRGYPHGTALNVFYLLFWLKLTVLFWSFLMIFFHAASVNLWSHSSDLPAVFIAPPHQFIFFGLSPHLPGPHSPIPIFLSFSLFFLFFFVTSACCQFGGHALAAFTGSPRRSKRYQKKPQASYFPSSYFFVCFVE